LFTWVFTWVECKYIDSGKNEEKARDHDMKNSTIKDVLLLPPVSEIFIKLSVENFNAVSYKQEAAFSYNYLVPGHRPHSDFSSRRGHFLCARPCKAYLYRTRPPLTDIRPKGGFLPNVYRKGGDTHVKYAFVGRHVLPKTMHTILVCHLTGSDGLPGWHSKEV